MEGPRERDGGSAAPVEDAFLRYSDLEQDPSWSSMEESVGTGRGGGGRKKMGRGHRWLESPVERRRGESVVGLLGRYREPLQRVIPARFHQPPLRRNKVSIGQISCVVCEINALV
jgi:hypothetical protein